MSAAASKTIVLHANRILSLFEGKSHLLASEYVSVEVLTEDLSCFIVYLVLRIDHNDIFSTSFKEHFANNLRMARVNKD